MANDLREIIGAIRVAGDLERVGIWPRTSPSARSRSASRSRVPRAVIGIKHMNEFATELMKDVLDAYAQRDVERALDTSGSGTSISTLEDSVFRDLLTHMMEDPRNILLAPIFIFARRISADR